MIPSLAQTLSRLPALPPRPTLLGALRPVRPAPAQAAAPTRVEVRGGRDALVVHLGAGDTLYALARRFAADTNRNGRLEAAEVNSYLADVLKANARLDPRKLPVGQAVLLPATANATYDVTAAIAVQKHLATQHVRASRYDWSTLETSAGPLESLHVSIARANGKRDDFLVFDDASGDRPDEYRVWTEAAFTKHWAHLIKA